LSVAESDAAIVRRVLRGDVEAFAVLVARHKERGARFAFACLGDRDDAEEALQDAFIRAYRSLGGCREPERFGAWFLQILVNRCRTRGAMRQRRGAVFVQDDIALERASSPRRPAGTDEDLREDITRALARLDPLMREAFVLKHVDGLEYEEMARLVHASVPALKMRVKRACDRLRVMLQEEEDAGTHA
jgi:RNA polymerase sigma-70 factor (ECF subfamily)